MWMGIFQTIESMDSTKRQKKWGFAPSAWGGTSIFSCPWTSALLVLRPSDLTWTYAISSSIIGPLGLNWTVPPNFLVLQLANGRSWDFLAYIIIWVNPKRTLSLCMSTCAQLLSHVRLFVAPQTVALQGLLSVGFSRQEYWSGLPFPPPGDLPDPPRDRTHVSCVGRWILYHGATREAKYIVSIDFVSLETPDWYTQPGLTDPI